MNFDFPSFINGKYEEAEDHFKITKDRKVDPFFVFLDQILYFQVGFGEVFYIKVEKWYTN